MKERKGLMKETIHLTPTSYLVLGLLASRGPSTSYDLEQAVGHSIGYFWSFPHTQLYSEPPRLAAAGLLEELRENTGRRRRIYTITNTGKNTLSAWLTEPTGETTEVRDLGLLKLFFGGLTQTSDIVALAREQERLHRQRLARYEELEADITDEQEATYELATLQMGMYFERAMVAFWSSILEEPSGRKRTPKDKK